MSHPQSKHEARDSGPIARMAGWLHRLVRRQRSQIATHVGSRDGPTNPCPYEVLLRHHYKSVSELLEEAEKQDASEWVDWSESKRIFLPVLLDLWKRTGRPEIRWPTMPHLPALDTVILPSGNRCVLESYRMGMDLRSNEKAEPRGTNSVARESDPKAQPRVGSSNVLGE